MGFPLEQFGSNRKEKIGKLRHKGQLVTYTTTRDAAGGEVPTWVTGAEFWCMVEFTPVGSEDDIIADRYTNVKQAKVYARHQDISPSSRFIFDGDQYEIISISPGTRKRWLQMEVTQYTPDNA